MVGRRWSHSDGLPCHKAIATRPNRGLVVGVESEVPQRFSMALLMMVMVRMVSSANPPSVSATRGTKSVTEERQAERLAASFLCTPTWRAWPGVWAA